MKSFLPRLSVALFALTLSQNFAAGIDSGASTRCTHYSRQQHLLMHT